MFKAIKALWTRYVLRRELTRLSATESAARHMAPVERINHGKPLRVPARKK
jgi:hypothetical protein